jgi:Domain of unknown function (DUF5666)
MTTHPEMPPGMLRRREWMAAVLAALAGCGGGVDSGGTGTGSADPTLAIGTIAGFGSIVVNGVRFDDATAVVSDDDAQAIRSDQLRLGMRVELSASSITLVGGVASATASSIRVRSDIVGPVETIDAVANRLVVLGQRVDLVGTTVVEGGLASLSPGIVVRVHGTVDIAGERYVASRIEPWSGTAPYKLRGPILALDLTLRTLDIGTLRVDWSAVAPDDPADTLAEGRLVTLRLDTLPTADVWTALSIDTDRAASADDRENAEVEGRITAWTSVTSFTVDGLQVDASAAEFPDGRSGVVLGAKVEVHGRIESNVLRALRVALEDDEGDDESFELHGRIESVDSAARTFVVRSTTVRWSDATRFDSSTEADLVAGREVELRGRLAPDGLAIDATVIHVEN